jgi:pilus assembly protein CpaB
MKKKTIFLIALLMAGVATLLFYQYTNQIAVQSASQQQKTTVIAAAVLIEKDKQITAEMLKSIEVPTSSVHAQAVVDAASIVGQYAVANIAVDEVILQHHVQSLEEASFLSGKIQQGYRAVTLSGGKIETVANMIEPEDTIDIVYSGPPLVGPKTVPLITMILQENVRVLSVGRRMKTTEAFVEYDSITLEVKQKEAVDLIKASKTGAFHLILHSKKKETE